MTSEEHCLSYEELRNKNVERNRKMMEILGLLPTREKVILQSSLKHSASKSSVQEVPKPRRSERIASRGKLSVCRFQSTSIGDVLTSKIKTSSSRITNRSSMSKRTVQSSASLSEEEINAGYNNMDEDNKLDGYDTDVSLDSMYAKEFNIDGQNSMGTVPDEVVRKEQHTERVEPTLVSGSAKADDAEVAAAFGRRCQEMIFHCLMQSAKAFTDLPKDVDLNSVNLSSVLVPMDTGENTLQKTWSEQTYNIVKARRRRETTMSRTSAGEGSDSQKDFPIPENETPQQRAVRNRRLNRLRAKRAKDLTDNRRAFKKRPYVLHVDGMAKAKGIHRHTWRAALRGQCGRLDPTMDNINHHPKKVVDSIWEALQKEWEFEGFSHRAREMFERSATKFMRNRKMQLKYKCQRIADDSKPNDVNEAFWKKIVQVTKKGSPRNISAIEGSESSKSKKKMQELEQDNYNSHEANQIGDDCQVLHNSCTPRGSELPLMEIEDVDDRIRSLQEELLRLQKSREGGFKMLNCENAGGNHAILGLPVMATMHASDKVMKNMKENIQPQHVNITSDLHFSTQKTITEKSGLHDKLKVVDKGKKIMDMVECAEEMQGSADCNVNVEDIEMDCGDIVKVFAYSGRVKEEIGKGVVMGLASSKFAKKLIPKAWRSIKMTSWTVAGGTKICPFPPGWPEQLKMKTVEEANGRIILWPDMLLQSM